MTAAVKKQRGPSVSTTSSASTTRVEQLERTILELGTEIFKLRSHISDISKFEDRFLKTMRGLKIILDDKGLITSEDFETALDLGEENHLAAHSLEDLDVNDPDLKNSSSH